MRQGQFTLDNLMKYIYGEQISKIPPKMYNDDAQVKYLDFGSLYTYCCHGNKEHQIKRWLRERIAYVDSMMEYYTSQDDQVTIRMNKTGYVEFEVTPYVPLYLSVKWSNADNGTQTFRVKRGETKKFYYTSTTATDQEIIIPYASQIKRIDNLSNLTPSSCILSNAIKLTNVEIHSNELYNINVTNNKYLRRVDLRGCKALGTVTATGSSLDLSNCKYLQFVDVYDTALTEVQLNSKGGSLVEIYYPNTVQSIQLIKQNLLETIGIPYGYRTILSSLDDIDRGVAFEGTPLSDKYIYRNDDSYQDDYGFISDFIPFDYKQNISIHRINIVSEKLHFDIYYHVALYDKDKNFITRIGSQQYIEEFVSHSESFDTSSYNNAVYFKVSMRHSNVISSGVNPYKDLDEFISEHSIINGSDVPTFDVCTSLYNINIQECPSIKKLNTSPNPKVYTTFLGMSYCDNLTLRNSLDLKELKFDAFHRLKKAIIENMYNLKNIQFNNLLTVGEQSTIEYIGLSNCPLLETLEFNCTSNDYEITFADKAIINLGGLFGLKSIHSNCVLKGIETIVLPTQLESMFFTNEYGSGYSTIKNLWASSVCSVNTDGAVAKATHIDSAYAGIDFKGMNLKNLDLGALVNIPNAINFSLSPTTVNPNFNKNRDGVDLPYLKPIGTLDLSNYTASLIEFFKGVDLDDLEVICSKNLEQRHLNRCFCDSTFTDINSICNLLSKLPNANNFSNCFEGTTISSADVLNYINVNGECEMSYMFYRCNNLLTVDLERIPNGTTSLMGIFQDCMNLQTVNIDYMPPSVKMLSYAFQNCKSLTNVTIGNIEDSSIESFKGCFQSCSALTSDIIIPLSAKNVTNMFRDCIGLTHIHSNWNNEYNNEIIVTDCYRGCSGITHIDDEPLELAEYATALDEIPIAWGGNGFDRFDTNIFEVVIPTDNYVLTMDAKKTLFGDGIIDWGDDIINYGNDFNSVSNIMHTYENAGTYIIKGKFSTERTDSLKECLSKIYQLARKWVLNGHTFDGCYNLQYAKIVRPTIANLKYVFANNPLLEQIDGCDTWDTSQSSDFTSIFSACRKLKSVDVSNWDTTGATSFYYLFRDCNALEIADVSNWNVKKVTNMSNMFSGCHVLSELDMSSWETNELSNISSMFDGCTQLQKVVLPSFSLSPITQINNLFAGCTNLKECNNLIIPDTVTNINSLFLNCNSLESIDGFTLGSGITSFDRWRSNNLNSFTNVTLKTRVIDFSNDVNLRKFTLTEESTITDYSNMFEGCISLVCDSKIPSKATNVSNMYKNCSSMTHIHSNWDNTYDGEIITTDCYSGCIAIDCIDEDNLYTDEIRNGLDEIPIAWGGNDYSRFETNIFEIVIPSNNYEIVISGKNFLGDGRIDWGDGTITTKDDFNLRANIYHTYSNAGTYRIKGKFTSSQIGGMTTLLTKIHHWARNWSINNSMFKDFANLNYVKIIKPKLTAIGGLFENCVNLVAVDGLETWDTSSITSLNNVFSNCTSLSRINVSTWNTSSVTQAYNTFLKCNALSEIDVSNWNVSSIVFMLSMFQECKSLSRLNVSNWDVKSVKNMTFMFRGCESLIELDVSNWKTDSLTEMNGIFFGCKLLETIDISNWKTDNLTVLSNAFNGCNAVKVLDLSKWNMPKLTSASSVFYDCGELTELDLSGFTSCQATDLSYMFRNCAKLAQLNTEKLNVSNTSNFIGMFFGCNLLDGIDVSKWDVSKATNMTNMFNGCTSLKQLNVSEWNVGEVTTMEAMFCYCSSLTELDLSRWDVRKLTKIRDMFVGCSSLETLNILGWNTLSLTDTAYIFTNCSKLKLIQGISDLKMDLVTDMRGVFRYCYELDGLNLSKWNTQNAYSLDSVFLDCRALKTLNVSTWNVSNVLYSTNVFRACSSLEYVDISAWRLSKAITTSAMFFGCAKLKELYVPNLLCSDDLDNISDMFNGGCTTITNINASNWNVSNVKSFNGAFTGCSSLQTIDISNWNVISVERVGSMFANCSSLVSVPPIENWDTSNLKQCQSMFEGCRSMVGRINLTNWDLSLLTNGSKMFNNSGIQEVIGLKVVGENSCDFNRAFATCSNLSLIDNLELGANISDITNLFYDTKKLTRITNLTLHLPISFTSNYILQEVTLTDRCTNTNYESMFEGCTSLTKDIIIPKSATNVSRMFYGCTAMTHITSNWNKTYDNEIIPTDCYKGCSNITHIDGVQITINEFSSIFDEIPYEWGGYGFSKDCTAIYKINVPNGNYSVKAINELGWNKDYSLGNGVVSWGDGSVTVGEYDHVYALPGEYIVKGHIRSGGKGDSTEMQRNNVVEIIQYPINAFNEYVTALGAFQHSSLLERVNIQDVVLPSDISLMFNNCPKLVEVVGWSNSNMNNPTNMSSMFCDCLSLESLDWSDISVSESTNTSNMFKNVPTTAVIKVNTKNFLKKESDCGFLGIFAWVVYGEFARYTFDSYKGCEPTECIVEGGYSYVDVATSDGMTTRVLYSNNLSKPTRLTFENQKGLLSIIDIDTSMITNMSNMFNGCSSLTSINLTNFNTSKVTDMSSMFEGCSELTLLDTSKFDVAKVSNTSKMFNGCYRLTSLNLFGTSTDELQNCEQMFKGCSSLTSLSLPKLNTAKVTNMSNMFNGCSSLTWLDLSGFNTAKVSNMSGMFRGCNSLTSMNISSVRTGSVTDMSYMFCDCSELTNLMLSQFNTEKVTNMYCMFYGCLNLTTLDISNFNTSITENIGGMFGNCNNLTTLNLSHFNTPNVTNMCALFSNCINLTTLDISNFNTANVTTLASMFENCAKLTALDLSHFETPNLTDASAMLKNCTSLTSLNISNLQIDVEDTVTEMLYGVPSNIDISVITSNFKKNEADCSFEGTFNWTIIGEFARYVGNATPSTCTINGGYSYLDISENNTTVRVLYALDGTSKPTKLEFKNQTGLTSVTSIDASQITNMSNMFYGCSSLESISMNKINTSNVTNMSSMFEGCSSMTNADVYGVNTATTNISRMFYGCSNLTSVYFRDCNLSNVQDASYLFYGCKKLTTINGLSQMESLTDTTAMFRSCHKIESLDLSTFNTSEVTNMYSMFYGCVSLTSLNLSSFNTSKVTNMNGMFRECSSLTSIDLSNFNTSNVTIMSSMFETCSVLTSLNLSNFNTSKVTNMNDMFDGCKALTSLNLSSFNTSKVTNMNSMFVNCSSLTSLDLSHFDTSSLTDIAYMFVKCSSLTSLNLSSFDASNVTNMTNTFYECNSLMSLNLSNLCVSPSCITTQMFYGVPSNAEITVTNTKFQKKESDCGFLGRFKWIILGEFGRITGDALPSNITITGGYSYVDIYDEELGCDVRVLYANDGVSIPKSMDFTEAGKLKSVIYLNMTNITNLSEMFYRCTKLVTVNCDNWDTSNVKNMYRMCYACYELKSINCGNWNTSNVTSMEEMFDQCHGIESLDLSGWDTSKVTTMEFAFYGTSRLKSLNLSSWTVTKETNVRYMFGSNTPPADAVITVSSSKFQRTESECGFSGKFKWIIEGGFAEYTVNKNSDPATYLPSICDIEGGYSYATESSNTYDIVTLYALDGVSRPTKLKFSDMPNILTINFIDTFNIEDASEMFSLCFGLKSVDLSHYPFNPITTSCMFSGCQSLESIDFGYQFNTRNTTDMSAMFADCSSLTSLSLLIFDTRNVTNMASMFIACSSLTYLIFGGDFVTNNVTSMTHMFDGCESLVELDLSNFEVGSDVDTEGMLYGCYYLEIVTVVNTKFHKTESDCGYFYYFDWIVMGEFCSYSYLLGGDIEGLETLPFECTVQGGYSYKTTPDPIGGMREVVHLYPNDGVSKPTSISFKNCRIYELYSLDTSLLTTTKDMFNGCTSLYSVDLSDSDFTNITDMSYMFYGCSSLRVLDFGTSETPNLTNITSMFQNCKSITNINLSSFNATTAVNKVYNLVSGCSELVTLDLSGLSFENINSLSGSMNAPTISTLTTLITPQAVKGYGAIALALNTFPNLSTESILGVINNLLEVPTTSPSSSRTFVLGNNANKLTEEQLQIIIDKGYVIS